MDEVLVAPHIPPVWIVVFCRNTQTRWVRWLALGRYKHVRAYAYLPAMRAWIFYDVSLSITGIYAAPDDAAAEAYIGKFTADADLISIRPAPSSGLRLAPFSCVSAIKHLIGLRSGALRPDALFRDCLAAGGELLGRRHTASTSLRPAG